MRRLTDEFIASLITPADIQVCLKHFPQGLTSFDIETTGLSAAFHEVIEIGAVQITEEGKLKSYHSLIRAKNKIPNETYQYHKISDSMLENEPDISTVLPPFIDFLQKTPTCAHNAQYDTGFITSNLFKNNLDIPENAIFDSLKLAKCVWKKNDIKSKVRPTNFKLSSIAEFFKIDFTHHFAHEDALICLKIMIEMLKHYDEKNKNENPKKIVRAFYYARFSDFNKMKESVLNESKNKKLQKIFKSMDTNLPLTIVYRGGSYRNVKRPLKALSLLDTPGGKILYAKCLITDFNKNFMLKKISQLDIIENEEVVENMINHLKAMKKEF